MYSIPAHLAQYSWYAPHLAYLGFDTGAEPKRADLSDADLSDADLIGADLPYAPLVPDIDRAICAILKTGDNSLDGRAWHACETTHCRAGWAVVLAGEAGKVLEDQLGTNAAAAVIYARSRPDKPTPDWFAGDREAAFDLGLAT